MTRDFSMEFLRAVYLDESKRDAWQDGFADSDHLTERWFMVFEHDGLFWRVEYREMTRYYLDSCGDDDPPFKYGATKACVQVTRVPVTTYTYQEV